MMCRFGFQKELFILLEKLVRDMDKKIERQRERAEKESEPRVLTADDQRRLDEILVGSETSPANLLNYQGLNAWLLSEEALQQLHGVKCLHSGVSMKIRKDLSGSTSSQAWEGRKFSSGRKRSKISRRTGGPSWSGPLRD